MPISLCHTMFHVCFYIFIILNIYIESRIDISVFWGEWLVAVSEYPYRISVSPYPGNLDCLGSEDAIVLSVNAYTMFLIVLVLSSASQKSARPFPLQHYMFWFYEMQVR